MRSLRDGAANPAMALLASLAFVVVLSSSIYAWAHTRDASEDTGPIRISLAGVAGATQAPGGEIKIYGIVAATPGARYADIVFLLDRDPIPCHDATRPGIDSWSLASGGGAKIPCDGAAPDAAIVAGDVLTIYDAGAGLGGAPSLRGREVGILDVASDLVVLHIPIA